jgi:N-acylneuraminate cytidylyltransferase
MTLSICVIPARGGSKRIPHKNIRPFCGKPMIAWSIEAAQKSELFEQILVSTDDPAIAEVARSFGATVPFMRPPELADDFAGTTPVVAHTVQWFLEQNTLLGAVCCLYATAPFVQPADLRRGLELLNQTPSDRFVFTASTYASPIQRALKFDPDTGLTQMWQPENFGKRSQDLEEAFHDAGQFYWGRPFAWLTADNLFQGSQILVLPRWRVQDIDTEDDWVRAELMHKTLSRIHPGYALKNLF